MAVAMAGPWLPDIRGYGKIRPWKIKRHKSERFFLVKPMVLCASV